MGTVWPASHDCCRRRRYRVSPRRGRLRAGASRAERAGQLRGHPFGHEEDCLARYHCPVATANAAAHKDFVATFASFKAEYERDGATAHLVVRIESELMRWLTGHIKRTDTQLAACVKNRAA